jgi:hypothetical protein
MSQNKSFVGVLMVVNPAQEPKQKMRIESPDC